MTTPHQDETIQWRDLFKQAGAENARTLHDTNSITDLAVAKLRAYEAEIAQLKAQLAESRYRAIARLDGWLDVIDTATKVGGTPVVVASISLGHFG